MISCFSCLLINNKIFMLQNIIFEVEAGGGIFITRSWSKTFLI